MNLRFAVVIGTWLVLLACGQSVRPAEAREEQLPPALEHYREVGERLSREAEDERRRNPEFSDEFDEITDAVGDLLTEDVIFNKVQLRKNAAQVVRLTENVRRDGLRGNAILAIHATFLAAGGQCDRASDEIKEVLRFVERHRDSDRLIIGLANLTLGLSLHYVDCHKASADLLIASEAMFPPLAELWRAAVPYIAKTQGSRWSDDERNLYEGASKFAVPAVRVLQSALLGRSLYRVGDYGRAQPALKRARTEWLPIVAFIRSQVSSILSLSDLGREPEQLTSIVETNINAYADFVSVGIDELRAAAFRATGQFEAAFEAGESGFKQALALYSEFETKGIYEQVLGVLSGSGASQILFTHLEDGLKISGSMRARAVDHGARAIQLLTGSAAATALRRMAGRSGGGGPQAALLREREVLLEQYLRQLSVMGLDATGAVAEGNIERLRVLIESREAMELLKKRLRIQEIDAQIQLQYPELFKLTSSAPIGVGDLRGLLKPNEAAIQFATFETFSVALVVTSRGEPNLVKIGIGRAEMEKLAATTRSIGRNTLRSTASADFEELYQRVFCPAETQLAGATRVLVVTDGGLAKVPLSMLTSSSRNGCPNLAGEGRPLVERYSFSTLPSLLSLSVIRGRLPQTKARKTFLGFGAPLLPNPKERLPGSADELRAVASALGGADAEILLGADATEERVKRLNDEGRLANYRVIEFATHAWLDVALPGAPGEREDAIALTPPPKPSRRDDGLLSLGEITSLNLDADLVILSACDTASGTTTDPSALAGFARSFFVAKARRLIATHWPVNDAAAAQLISQMVREKQSGVTWAEALRRAQLSLTRSSGLAHPGYWAPFVLVGDE